MPLTVTDGSAVVRRRNSGASVVRPRAVRRELLAPGGSTLQPA